MTDPLFLSPSGTTPEAVVIPAPPPRDRQRPSALTEDDYQLSMALSPRARREENNEGLRSLLVHRLRDSRKAAFRWSLRNGKQSMYCEPCREWTPVDGAPPAWICERCHRLYRAELVIYSEVVHLPSVEPEADDSTSV